jgi:hypothetical protein
MMKNVPCARARRFDIMASQRISTIFRSLREVERYTKAADQKRLAVSAMKREQIGSTSLVGKSRHSERSQTAV